MRAWPPVRRRRRRKSLKNALSEILGLLCVEQNVRNIETCTFRYSGTRVRRTRRRRSQKMHFREFWDSSAQKRTSEISKNALPRILGLLCAEQDVGNLKNYTSRNSATPVRRPKRRISQKMHFQDFWDSSAQTKTSKISKIALSGFLRLLCAEQHVGNI